jgi:hypothetical protein
MKVVLLRFWFIKQAPTERVLLELDLSESTSIKELGRLLHDEAVRVDPKDNSPESMWTLDYAYKFTNNNFGFAFSDEGSFRSREYVEGDDNTTIQELLKQQIAKTSIGILTKKHPETTIEPALYLYATNWPPRPGNLYVQMLTGKVVSFNIPEDEFSKTTINQVLDMLADREGYIREQLRLYCRGKGKLPQDDTSFEALNILPKETIFALFRLHPTPPSSSNAIGNEDPPKNSSTPTEEKQNQEEFGDYCILS